MSVVVCNINLLVSQLTSRGRCKRFVVTMRVTAAPGVSTPLGNTWLEFYSLNHRRQTSDYSLCPMTDIMCLVNTLPVHKCSPKFQT